MSVVRARGRWHGNQKYTPVHLTKKARKYRKKQSKKRTSRPPVGCHGTSDGSPALGPEHVMGSGKHRGVQVKDLPFDYLDWCASKGFSWAVDELLRREGRVDRDGGVDREFQQMIRNF